MTMSSEPHHQQQQQQRKPSSTSPTLSTILNKKPTSSSLDTPMKEYLPTPVTPASDFPHQIQQHSKKDTNHTTASSAGVYSTFSVIKPPQAANPSTAASSAAASQSSSTSASPKNNQTTDAKPYPCPECHQTFSRPHNLKSHLTTHSSERPFQVSYY